MTDHLIIFQKLYDLYLYTHVVVSKFPKSQRFLISNKLLESNLEMLRLTIVANSKSDRREEQKQISVLLDIFRIHVRLSKDMNMLSIKRYTHFMELINEIGRLLNAWKGSTK
ncbi:MAG: diversity-generating retroelement protein Avd [Candidatus Pacebacteria bacterium]|nr:diversity-generating retroelement protein Avd [Candidatus Paceibacterota bacterium]